MVDYKEPEITRTENIVVRSTTKTPKNYLVVTDEGGKEHKISPKRERLFPIFQPGTAVHLSYAQYNNIDYVADAVPLSQMIDTVKPKETGGVGVLTVTESTPPVSQEMTKADWDERDKHTRKSIERQKSLELAVAIAKNNAADSTAKVIAIAKQFEAYLEGKEVQPKKSKLVEEAKKLGAEEIDPEEIPF